MSMNFYIQSGAESELAQLAGEGVLSAITIQAVRGRAGVPAESVRAAVASLDLGEEAFEAQFRAYEDSVSKKGFLARLFHRFTRKELKASIVAQRQAMLDEIEGVDDDIFGGDAPEVLELHKSWQMLHFLFTGTAWDGPAPANTLLKGGREVGDDLGYGPARIVSAREASAFAAFLAPLQADALRRKLDVRKMAALDIYCADDPSDEGAVSELEDDLEHYFPALQHYVQAAAARRDGLALWMS